jgi:hypothetical protein
MQDGFAGTANLSANGTANTNTLNIQGVVTNATINTIVYPGVRFTVAGETVNTAVHTVLTVNTSSNVTDCLATFTPNLGAGTYDTANIVTFLPAQIEIKIGEGNLTWSEKKEYVYLLDRGNLDTVKEGNEVPVELSLEFVYEHVKTGTNEDITPVDALKKTGNTANWVSSSADQCEPYAVHIVVFQDVPCGTVQDETLTFHDFRYESLDFDLAAATIAVSGKCNVSEVDAVRS